MVLALKDCDLRHNIFSVHSGSVGRALDWGLKGCWFEPQYRETLCCVLEKGLVLVNTGRPVLM